MGKGLSIVELTLDEMMADPIVRLTMRRDSVSETEVRALIGTMVANLDSLPVYSCGQSGRGR